MRARALALAAVTALTLTACSAGSSSNPSATGNGGGTSGSAAASGSTGGSSGPSNDAIAIGLVLEPASLDFTTTDGAAIPQALLDNVYEGLVKLDQDGKIVPDLAKSWTVSPDRKTYTFDLVDNATFTNGAKFTADDAAFSINRVKTDWTISLKAAMDVVESAKADSPTKLVVTLKQPSNDWLYRMTTRIGAMFSKTGVDKLATDPVGTGPYKLDKW
ncbi:MAG: ABC transporter substrate-binding protein, partial [Actinomycetes bacterium]